MKFDILCGGSDFHGGFVCITRWKKSQIIPRTRFKRFNHDFNSFGKFTMNFFHFFLGISAYLSSRYYSLG